MIKLSFIVPIYNVEDYIIECLASIFSQIYDNSVEIILVNDGCTDNSMKVVKDFLSEQPSILTRAVKTINQKNKGLSAARNSGLKIASGDFIYFLDSDDYISSNFLKEVLPIIKDSIDIIEFNSSFFYLKGDKFNFTYRKNVYEAGLHKIESEEMRAKLYGWQDWAVWYRVYNKEIWKDRLFPKGLLYEDVMTVPFIYQDAKSIYSLDSTLVYYRNNPNSIMNKKNKESLSSVNHAIQLLKNVDQSSYIKIVRNRFCIASVNVLLNNIGVYATYYWIQKNFNNLTKNELDIIESKRLILINRFPYMTIPYFKLKSKGFFK